MGNDTTIPEFHQVLQRVEELLAAAERITDPRAHQVARDLAAALLELHTAGLIALFNGIREAGGQELVDGLAATHTVSELLLLHGLHPIEPETRVRQALDDCRPYLNAHDGDVELVGVSADGIVRLRLHGNCDGCPSSRMRLHTAIEEAIYAAAPDVTGIEVDGIGKEEMNVPAEGFVPGAALTNGLHQHAHG